MSSSFVGRSALAVSLLTALLWAESSLAATVVLVQPSNPAPGMSEAFVRVHGELISAGFEVESVDGSVLEGMEGLSRAGLEQLAARRGAEAVVAILGNRTPDSVEVWVIDKVTGKSVVRRVPFQPRSTRGSETLAIQAIELLRASFLEIELSGDAQRKGPQAAPPPTIVHFVEMEREAERPEGFGVEVGGAASMSLGGVGPAVMPVVDFDWAVRPSLVVQATLAGLGNRPTVRAGANSAQVTQGFVVLGAAYRFRPEARWHPFVSLSAGALHTSVDGQANWPLEGRHAGQWSFLLDGGIGASLSLRNRLQLSLAVHAQVADPYPTIRFAGSAVATSARPNLLLTLTIGAWL